MTRTFREWYEKHPLWDVRLPVVETWLAQCWRDATNAERERCKQEVIAHAREHAKAGLGLEAMAIRDVANALGTEERE